ncbi:MAG: calcium/proton exchanger [Isosphaeraceae bacterium]
MAKNRVNGPDVSGGSGADRNRGWFKWLDPRRVGWIRLLLVFLPVALIGHLLHAPAGLQFGASLLGLLPLAVIMGEATEHLAHRAGPGVGGLLNATFGNAAELIIALALLLAGEDEVVQATLTGSILGNILLVLGASLLAGGVRHATQQFNKTAAGIGATLMVIAAIGLLIPAIYHSLPEVLSLRDEQAAGLEHELSLAVSMALITSYLLSLVFSLRTHKDLFNPRQECPDDHEHKGPVWSIGRSVGVLTIATIGVGILSEILAGSIDETGRAWGLSKIFLGVIILPIFGNAAEHSTAIIVALKNKMDLAVGIALGSALQVALFVAPVLVFVSYVRPAPMDLVFSTMEVVAVILAILVARMVAEDGESNWLEGAMLLMVYAILGVVFYVLPGPVHESTSSRATVTSPPAATAPAH